MHHWPQKQKKIQSTFLLTNLSISQVLHLRLKTVTYQIQNIGGKGYSCNNFNVELSALNEAFFRR